MRSVIPWLNSVFCRMVSKKGFAAGGGRANEQTVELLAGAMVVEEWEKADIGRWRVRRTPDGGAKVESSNSGSGEGGSDVMR